VVRDASDATRARRERDALLKLARDMAGGAPSTRRVLLHLADTAQAFTQAEGACVLELRDDVFHVVGPTGITTPYDGQAFTIMPPPSVFREVIATRQVVWTNDGQADPRVDPRFKHALGIRHLATAPIVVDGRIDGLLLVINSAQPAGFSTEDAAFLGRLAEFSAVALRDAELVRQADEAAAAAQRDAQAADTAARRSAVLARVAAERRLPGGGVPAPLRGGARAARGRRDRHLGGVGRHAPGPPGVPGGRGRGGPGARR
jgi:GAF domain-containing protein